MSVIVDSFPPPKEPFNLLDFYMEHPIICYTLIMAVYIGYEVISNARAARSLDVDGLEQRNREERKALEEKMHATFGEKLQDCREKLEFLESQTRRHLVTERFFYQVDEARSLFGELEKVREFEQADHMKELSKLHFCIKDLHAEYIQVETAWNDARAEWQTRWQQVHDLLEQARAFPLPLDTTAGRETVPVDCDYWSRGALSEAAAALPPLDQPENTSTGTFNTLSQQADQLYQRAASLIQQACQDFVHSQVRIQLGNSILESMYSRGWYLEQESDYGFRGDDQRDQLNLKLCSPVGDQVEFTINPDNTMLMRPKFKDLHNRSLLQLLSQVVQSALQRNGITVQSIT